MTKEEIKRLYSMKDILHRYGIQVGRGGFIRCPFHKDKTGSMKIYNDGFKCYGCGEYGDVIDFVSKMDNLTFKEAFVSLGGTYEKAENPKEVREKILKAQKAREEEEKRKRIALEEKKRNNDFITLLRIGIEKLPPYSDEWCWCQDKLPEQLHIHDELMREEVRK